MYDHGLSTLEQYGLTAKSAVRVRGALVCRTEEGILLLREFTGSEKKLRRQQELLLAITEKGGMVDSYLCNQEGSLVSRDKDNVCYTLQRWYEGKECDTKSRENILRGVRVLANLHKVMKLPAEETYMEKSLQEEFRRHNQEIRKIRKFIRRKGASCSFEKDFLAGADWFLDRGEKALSMLEDSSYGSLVRQVREQGLVCHGEYNQHNILILKTGTAVTNFNRWCFGVQMADLYRFMRKILEKYNWDICLGKEMLRVYHEEKGISGEEWENLRIRFTYPEKFWKLANYYYSHNKAWISGKNSEKLRNLTDQKEIWKNFTESCFAKYPF